MQTSESFRLSAILSLSGGLQDAYTYIMRDGVFANAQTGNVVLMGQSILNGNYVKSLYYLLPIIAFILGVILTERIEYKYKNHHDYHWRQIILLIEIILLFIVGLISNKYNMLANVLVSFSCAMQVEAFRKLHGNAYASTMCIGNLRSGSENLSKYLRDKNNKHLNSSLYYFGIVLIFALGAIIGGLSSRLFSFQAIWLSSFILLVSLLMMKKESL